MPRQYLAFWLGFSVLWTANAGAAFDSAQFNTPRQALEVLRITPDGEDVPVGRQVVFQFNQPVVPIGRMSRTAEEIPVSIRPALNCAWRWLNLSALACQLDEADALQPATRYRIELRPGLVTQEGARLAKPVHHTFVTERPRIRHAWFDTWRAPDEPHLRLTFNQKVTRRSVEEHVFLQDDSGRRVGVTVARAPDRRSGTRVLPVPGEKAAVVVHDGPAEPAAPGADADEPLAVWILKPDGPLGLDHRYRLVVEPGVQSAEGPEPGVERREVVAFDTFPAFAFLGVRCTDNAGQSVSIRPDQPPETQPRCSPLKPTALLFSAPVITDEVKAHLTVEPDLAGGRTDYDPWANQHSYSRLGQPHRKGNEYAVPFPEILKADQPYRLHSAAELRDEFGRILRTPVGMQFMTDNRPPEFALTHKWSVLEKGQDSETPVVVTNLDSLTVNYGVQTQGRSAVGLRQTRALPSAKNIAYRTPLGVRALLDGSSGVVVGSVDSVPGLGKSEDQRWFFAQVTPFHVHAKVGHFNTLVWVTDFATGRAVSGARVTVFRGAYRELALAQHTPLGSARTAADGAAILPGLEQLDPDIKHIHAWGTQSPRLFVRIEQGDDIALLPLDGQFSTGYFPYPSTHKKHGHIHAWGTTAQGVYRAGDTIQYKLYVRGQNNETFVPAPQETYTLKIVDPMDKVVEEIKDIRLNAFGAYDGEYTVPQTGGVGWYRFRLSANFYTGQWEPMRVLVSDFTPAPFRVSSDLNARMFQAGASLAVHTQASLHAGGPYADAQARITTTLEARPLQPTDPLAKGFYFATAKPGQATRETLNEHQGAVNAQGKLDTRFTIPETQILHGRILVESAVRDDRGKFVAGFANAEFMGRNRFVGLRQTRWLLQADQPAEVDVLVVDEHGSAAPGTPIAISIERRETKASRVKGAGNAYLTHYVEEWVRAGECKLVSAKTPSQCAFTPEEPGYYRVTATVEDTLARPHSTELHQWVAGKGQVLWNEPEGNHLQLIGEKETFRVGDTARYLVKNPFPGARALITVERYGVLKHWVQVFDTSTPVVEIPVDESMLPGFFVSVVVMSPRVAEPLGEDQVDLGKPAFRMGYAEGRVIDDAKSIAVDMRPERTTYRPGEKVKVTLSAKPVKSTRNEPIELAVIALDESVFDLIQGGREYFDPYEGFYTLDGLDVRNFSLLMKLVGRQKFEKKGASAGGDGGSALDVRRVFKYVGYWNPSLEVRPGKPVHIEFDAPDNLTGWRLLAVAVTPTDRMGLGEAGFKVNRPTEVRPVMPNQVTEGDAFQGGFTVMNRTEQARDVEVTIEARGKLAGGTATLTRSLRLEPYKRVSIWLPVKARGDGDILFTARAGDAVDRDGLVHRLPVRKRERLETAASYGTTVGDSVVERIAFPSDIRTDVGSVGVVLSPSVIGNVEGAFAYMRDYPYTCWEQKLTQGAMASHYLALKPYVPDTLAWSAAPALPQGTLDQAANHQAPNGGMTYFVPQDQYVSPYLSAYSALAFNWLRDSGYRVPAKVEERLHAYLGEMLRRDVMPDFYSRGMASTVRAAALAALSEHDKVSRTDLERYRAHVPDMSLFGKALYLQAALRVRDAEPVRQEVTRAILSHATQSGGKFSFNEVLDDSYSRILATPLRDNCAVLSALTRYGETAQGAALIGDIPFKLARSITQSRGKRDHWENTQENMFCMQALVDFARVYEQQAPDLKVRAFLGETVLGEAAFKDPRDGSSSLSRPIGPADPGTHHTLRMERTGQGRIYYSARVQYATLEQHAERVNAGIEVRREYSVERGGRWVLLQNDMQLGRGELVRVDLYVSLPTARNFVVVDDPVPGGLEPVNRDLATASRVDADKGETARAGGSWWFRYGDWQSYGVSRWSFYHQELRHDAVRFYSEYLPAGNYHLSYTAQAIAGGTFTVMPVKAEEMYDPDVYGMGLPARLQVRDEHSR